MENEILIETLEDFIKYFGEPPTDRQNEIFEHCVKEFLKKGEDLHDDEK